MASERRVASFLDSVAPEPACSRCRASDADGQTQPRVSTKHKGYLYNGWSRVEVTVTPSE